MAMEKDFSHSWWFASQNRTSSCGHSLWLTSTLSELDKKTQQMLKLIEEDADSFARRAEMYYKKRPQLVSMIEDFYRNHRSLAEQYDQLKNGCGARRSISLAFSSLDKSWSPSVCSSSETDETAKDDSLDSYDSDESEIIDKEQEENEAESDHSDVLKLKRELDKLREENASLKAELAGKDEEKREVIRQLALSMDILREENSYMRTFTDDTKKKGGVFQFKKLTENIFSGKFFGRQQK